MLKGTKSGSILLFHNDLENTTEALPAILTQLRDDGYEFVKVSNLIYNEDYSINAEGRQIPDTKAGLDISADNVDEVMAQYSDKLAEMGFTEEQIQAAAKAVKGGAEMPEQVLQVISQLNGDTVPDGEENAPADGNTESAPEDGGDIPEEIPDSEGEDVPDISHPDDEGGVEIEDDKGSPQK